MSGYGQRAHGFAPGGYHGAVEDLGGDTRPTNHATKMADASKAARNMGERPGPGASSSGASRTGNGGGSSTGRQTMSKGGGSSSPSAGNTRAAAGQQSRPAGATPPPKPAPQQTRQASDPGQQTRGSGFIGGGHGMDGGARSHGVSRKWITGHINNGVAKSSPERVGEFAGRNRSKFNKNLNEKRRVASSHSETVAALTFGPKGKESFDKGYSKGRGK